MSLLCIHISPTWATGINHRKTFYLENSCSGADIKGGELDTDIVHCLVDTQLGPHHIHSKLILLLALPRVQDHGPIAAELRTLYPENTSSGAVLECWELDADTVHRFVIVLLGLHHNHSEIILLLALLRVQDSVPFAAILKQVVKCAFTAQLGIHHDYTEFNLKQVVKCVFIAQLGILHDYSKFNLKQVGKCVFTVRLGLHHKHSELSLLPLLFRVPQSGAIAVNLEQTRLGLVSQSTSQPSYLRIHPIHSSTPSTHPSHLRIHPIGPISPLFPSTPSSPSSNGTEAPTAVCRVNV